jgi:hypothetical protein
MGEASVESSGVSEGEMTNIIAILENARQRCTSAEEAGRLQFRAELLKWAKERRAGQT